jgi:hypothetical protein
MKSESNEMKITLSSEHSNLGPECPPDIVMLTLLDQMLYPRLVCLVDTVCFISQWFLVDN